MPRNPNTVPTPTAVVSFFRTAPMETIDIVMDLVKGAISERRAKSAKIAAGREKAKVATPAAPAATSHHKGKGKGRQRKPVDQDLPLDQTIDPRDPDPELDAAMPAQAGRARPSPATVS